GHEVLHEMLQHDIAAMVAVGIIDPLEVVDVADQHTHRLLQASGVLQDAIKCTTVQNTGQRIGVALLLDGGDHIEPGDDDDGNAHHDGEHPHRIERDDPECCGAEFGSPHTVLQCAHGEQGAREEVQANAEEGPEEDTVGYAAMDKG